MFARTWEGILDLGRDRIVATLAIVSWVSLLASPVLSAQDREPPDPDREERQRRGVSIDKATRIAISRGLDYLARSQNKNGSWTDRVGRKVHMTYRGTVAQHVGVTALAGIAFLSAGVLPDQGPGGNLRQPGPKTRPRNYCEVVQRALSYTMDHTSPIGFITDNGSRMYSHAFAALFLAEVYGTGYYRDNARLKECLKRATALIVKAQNKQGGWRYRPGASDADMSVTVCQVMALRAARNAGIDVPYSTIDRAVQYVRRSYLPSIGAFTYQLGTRYSGVPSRHSFALTAAGLTTLYSAGEYSAPEIRNGLTYLWYQRPSRSEARNFDYLYGQYYAIQAAFQTGGKYWQRWYKYIQRDLVELQEADGRWTDLVGPNYATAMATIILQFPNQYLPITEN